MARKIPLLLLAWAGLLMTTGAHAQMSAEARQAEVDSLMSRYMGDAPGASLLVVKNGKAIIRRGYGYANLEKRIRTTPATNYRLASVSKQFTAACILLLAQDGKLSLDDSARKWLPELPASDAAITLENLLTHTSGLIDYESLIPPDRTTQLSDADVLRMIASQDTLYFPPGNAHRYSNGAYVLLGLIVERVSGMDLADFMHQRIFQPLGMNHTLMYEHHRGPKPTHRAYGYSLVDGQWKRTDQSLTSATRGDGGIYSSIDDLAKWDASLYGNRLLSDASKKRFFTASEPIGDPDVGYGYGWRISEDSVWKSGETMGFRNV
ncbi:MAG TPA: serine hydrolase domain-containing protein, partial [Rhodanobacteraceae bacterium]|nr:serine hydrolase domain-containing protein [Rhodanobacteraceae bacterium]